MPELAYDLAASPEDRLEQAEALVRSFCGWHIAASREETVVVRGDNGRHLMLPSMHVTDVAVVTVDGAPLTADDFTWSQAGVLTKASGWWGVADIAVELTHGYDIPPAEVTAIVQAVATRAVANPGSLLRKQVGPFADTYSTTGSNQVATLALLDSEKEALRRYRIPGIA